MTSVAVPADYHMHTPLCHHAEGWPKEYAAVAVERGLDEIGFSDHNPMATAFDDWRMSIDDLPRYLDEVEEARDAFANRLTIRCGLECDFLEGQEAWIEELSQKADWDYLIGSVHYIDERGRSMIPTRSGKTNGTARSNRSGTSTGKNTAAARAAGCSIFWRIRTW